MKKRKQKKKGFTLTEMLCTLLIMSLVSVSAVTGIVAMANSYKKVLRTTNAEQLCNVITTAMTGELSYAKYIETDTTDTSDGGETVQSFYSAAYHTCKYDIDGDRKLVIINDSVPYKVVSDKVYANGLLVSDFSIKYDSASKIFTVYLQIGDSITDKITSTTFKVKDLN